MPSVVPGIDQVIRDAFAGVAGSSAYPCLGARSVVQRDAFRLVVYPRLADPDPTVARKLAGDIAEFGASVTDDALSSFVAVFREPGALTERQFTELLWTQLQMIHDVDRRSFSWDPTVDSDPDSSGFSFSVGGAAYFVIGLHAGSSRWSRRFAWPALVFNPHRQFAAMRADGRYERMRGLIRDRDTSLQGTANPLLRDHGDGSEARQYAGGEPAVDWRCPLHVRQA